MDIIKKENHVPWIVFGARDWLEEYLTKDMRVFEWGSGGSTLYFSSKAGKIISVEHDKGWHNDVSRTLAQYNIANCEYHLILPQKDFWLHFVPYAEQKYNSKSTRKYRGYSFEEYSKKIDTYPDKYFDLVFVDGRARASCISHALTKIKDGGYLMLDNSERKSYQKIMKKLDRYQRRDFFGNGPYLKDPWQTTIWKISN